MKQVQILIAAEPIVRKALQACLLELDPCVRVLPAAPDPHDIPAVIAAITRTQVDVLVHRWSDEDWASDVYDQILSICPDLRILNAQKSGVGIELRRSVVCKQFACDSLNDLAQALQHQVDLSIRSPKIQASRLRDDEAGGEEF